ncbi:MAG: DUF4870 domain-containing protein [Planctomycetota bacterium]|nr:DUF4870 domain-containing protein [Planctomycetota bacterium]
MSIAMPAAEDSHVRVEPPALDRTGRIRAEGLSDTDRHFAIASHLSPFAWFLGLGPLALAVPVVLWLVRRNQSVFNDDHGREIVNFGLTFFLLHLLLAVTVVGIVVWPVLWVVAVVNMIRGAVAAGTGEYFRYPVTIRFLS